MHAAFWLMFLIATACPAQSTPVRASADQALSADDAKPAASEPSRKLLEVRIVPDRALWQPREPITGKYYLTNRGHNRISVAAPHFYRCIAVRNLDGSHPPQLGDKMYFCGNARGHNSPPIELEPGASCDKWFRIVTDRLDLTGGVELADGTYELNFQPSLSSLGVATHVIKAQIQVRTLACDGRSPRIVNFAVVGNRLIVGREDDSIESIDLVSGERQGAMVSEGVSLSASWSRKRMVSPDGEHMVRLRGKSSFFRTDYAVERLAVGNPGAAPTRVEIRQDSAYPASIMSLGFSHDRNKYYARSRSQVFEIDWPTLTVSAFPVANVFWMSPDAQAFVSRALDGQLRMTPRADLAAAVPLQHSTGARVHSVLPTAKGVYVCAYQSTGVEYYDYAGHRQFVLDTEGEEILAASPDGRLLVIHATSWPHVGDEKCSLEVWDALANAKLCEFSRDTHVTVEFTGDGAHLVCATTHGLGVTWFEDMFELIDPATGARVRAVTVTPYPAR